MAPAFPPAPALSSASPAKSPLPRPKRRGRTVKPLKRGRPSKRAKAGRLNWYNRLLRSGQLEEAARWHKRAGLARYGIPAPAFPPSAAPGASAPPAGAPASGSHAGTAPFPPPADHGGEGGQQCTGRENWDKTTQNGQNLQYGCKTTQQLQNSQCSPVATADAVPLAVEADLTRLAAKADCTPTVTPPAGESEGDSKKVNTIPTEASRLASMWPEGGEAIVGKLCRNKQYNELRVVGADGREMWTKVGNWSYRTGLIRGERVLVKRVWVSGDDTDAEYEVVKRLDVNEPAEEQQPQPESESGSDFGSESSTVPEPQKPVAILPQFQRVEPDYPRKQESGEDYIARIRAEAAMWANGQGR